MIFHAKEMCDLNPRTATLMNKPEYNKPTREPTREPTSTAVTVAEADLDKCVVICLVRIVMHWNGRDDNDIVRDKYMITVKCTFPSLVFTVHPATLNLADVHG